MHVLIIEDESLIALSIEDVLRDCGGVSFDFATTADEAVLAAVNHRPDLITADVELADGCGIDAVAMICPGRTIPVIFITGTAGTINSRRPGSVIVHKPFDNYEVKGAVGQAMANSNLSQAISIC